MEEAPLWWVGAAGVIGVCLLLLDYLSRTKIPLLRFFLTFRVSPGYTSETEKRLKQRIVDDELEERALRFYEEDMKERVLLQKRQGLEAAENPRKAIIVCRALTWRIRLQKIWVKRAKRSFWEAWNSAKHFRYDVKKKYTDHLPPFLLANLKFQERCDLASRAHFDSG